MGSPFLSALADLVDPPRDEHLAAAGDDWEAWLRAHIPYLAGPDVTFAPHHAEFWEWLWSIRRGVRPLPFVGIWPRGGGKSSSAEAAVVALAARRVRSYGIYVSGTQDQADKHVETVATVLESDLIAGAYPDLSERDVNQYGQSKGWKRARLRTLSGFTVDALGLDTSARGIKVDDHRPDFIVLDDVDDESDSMETIRKKIDKITKKLFPAGSNDVAILAIQNLVHVNSIFSRIAGVSDHKADFLTRKIVSGPFPALRNLEVESNADGEFTIVAGEPIWEGQNLDVCRAQVNDWGYSAFLTEAQQEVDVRPGGMYDHIPFDSITRDIEELPTLAHVVVWMDPAVSDTDQSDSCAIQCDGLDGDGVVWRLASWEQRTSPQKAMLRALWIAHEWSAEAIGVETDQGGDTWKSVFNEAYKAYETECAGKNVEPHRPSFRSNKAGSLKLPGSSQPAKAERSARMLSDYERGRFRHLRGTHTTLERALKRFPLTKPLDLADAAFWSWHDLRTRYGKGDQTKAAAEAMQWNVDHLTRPNPHRIH